MAVSSSDYRSLLGAGVWLAGAAAALAGWYGLAEDSSVALGLGLELMLVASAAWAARDLHRKRDGTENPSPQPPPGRLGEPSRADASAARLAAPTGEGKPESLPPLSSQGRVLGGGVASLRKAVQTETIVLASAAALVGLTALVQLLQQGLGGGLRESSGAAFGAVCLAGGFVWLVLARALQAIPRADLPEAEQLAYAFREAQWACFVAAGGLLGAMFHPPLALWTGRVLFGWVLVLCVEMLLRLTVPLVIPLELDKEAVAPIRLLLRESLFAAGNPIGSMLRSLETRLGVSLRSTWAIVFVKRATLPLLALLALLLWGFTSVAIVEMDQLGVREHFGRVAGEPLTPGLHFKLPWPFGRIRTFSVKTVHQAPIGFVEAEKPANGQEPRALLWTRGHAREEFALVLGGGTELVVVNALLYYKIAEDERGFLDYVYGQAAPEDALTAFAYRALMEETRGRTLDAVLSGDRAVFARRLADSVRRQSRNARLGLEVVDLALLNLHPPIEAAGSYLDVINARLDARRRAVEAEGKKQVALLAAQTGGATAVAAARVEATRRVVDASSQLAEFTAVGQGAHVAPNTFRLRLWIEALEQALSGQRMFLLDPSLLSQGGELLLDTRRHPSTPLPSPDVKPTPASPGAKKP